MHWVGFALTPVHGINHAFIRDNEWAEGKCVARSPHGNRNLTNFAGI
jgi:hypothetical protein